MSFGMSGHGQTFKVRAQEKFKVWVQSSGFRYVTAVYHGSHRHGIPVTVAALPTASPTSRVCRSIRTTTFISSLC